ncbi:mitochondrial carrier, partial [Blyttiomyces helicus]
QVRMQTATGGSTLGALGHVRGIIAKDGLKGMYRGVVPVLWGTPPVLSLCFWSYYIGQTLVYDYAGPGANLSDPRPPRPSNLVDTLTLPQVGVAGAFSAIPTAFIMGPAEQIKIRLQIQETSMHGAESKGVGAIVRGIVRESGVFGLFRGTGLTMMRDAPGSFFYFATYEAVRRRLAPNREEGFSPGAILLAGGLAGMANWTVAIPIDTLKSRYQSTPGASLRSLLGTHGFAGLFSGLGPTLLRAFPASAAFFFGAEVSTSFLRKVL